MVAKVRRSRVRVAPTRPSNHHPNGSGCPSAKPAADWIPTTTRSCSSASVDGPDVGAGAAHAGGDVVEQILDASADRVQRHPRRRDAFLEQRLAGALEGAVGGGAGDHRPLGRHAVALLVRLVVAVAQQVAGRFVGAGEPRPDHHVGRAGRQRQRHVPRVSHAAVGPHVCTELPCRRSAFEDSRELGPADAGHHPGGAHRARAHADLDDRRAGVDQVAGALRRHHVARDQWHTQVQRRDRLDRVHGLGLVPVGGVDDHQVDAGLGHAPAPWRRRRR